MKRKMFLFLAGIVLAAGLASSCAKETPAPTAAIYATIDGYKVTFDPQVTDVNTYSWDFGDGSALNTEMKPVHTYASFGDYTVKLTVKGDGGETLATKTITIEATSITDLLTGGASATQGKTWVLSKAYTAGVDGGGPVLNNMPLTTPSIDNVLSAFGLDAEYDNEFTFFFDGKYKMNLKNGNALSGAVYGTVTQTISGDPAYDIGMCAAAYTPPTNATWTLHPNTENFVVDAITDPMTAAVPPVHGNVTFTNKNWVTFSEGAYFGILDFPTTSKLIITNISSSKMEVVMFLCGYGYGGDVNMMMLPTNLIHMTYVVK